MRNRENNLPQVAGESKQWLFALLLNSLHMMLLFLHSFYKLKSSEIQFLPLSLHKKLLTTKITNSFIIINFFIPSDITNFPSFKILLPWPPDPICSTLPFPSAYLSLLFLDFAPGPFLQVLVLSAFCSQLLVMLSLWPSPEHMHKQNQGPCVIDSAIYICSSNLLCGFESLMPHLNQIYICLGVSN